MAEVIEVGELYRRRASLGANGSRYVRAFRVWRYETTNGQMRPLTSSEALDALNDQESVTFGSLFPGKPAFVCDSLEVDESDSGDNEWSHDILCEYIVPDSVDAPNDFNEFMNRSNGGGADSPTNPFGPERSGGGQVIDEYLEEDLDGKVFALPTGVPMQNVPPIPTVIQVDRITINEAAPASTARIGMCEGFYMLANVTYEELTHVNKETGVRTKYYRNSYERWNHPVREFSKIKILLYGFQAFFGAGANKELRNILVDDDDPKSDPVADAQPLTINGYRKTGGQKPDYEIFRIRPEGPLNIPFMSQG